MDAHTLNVLNVLTIVLMALVTYLTRVLGFVSLRGRTLSPRMMTVLQAAPGCVLISVIAPDFVSNRPADLLALAVTLLAASRLPLLPTVILGVLTSGVLRHVMP
ncbi:AzlD family protein [Deinococcus pimensis]|uniref:AzlD family protein n=1 Tax=Deinococcus pimensis TaxID=309888 RepID=UPI000482197F|nr:AzlD family protein [Deinococcus pimensis]